MRILFITQKVDQNDDLLGVVHEWLASLAGKVERLEVICLSKGKLNLPANVRVRSLCKEYSWSKWIRFFYFYRLALPLILKGEIDGVFVHMNEVYVLMLAPVKWLMALKKIPLLWWKTHGHLSIKSKIAVHFVDRILTASAESFPVNTKKKIATGHGIDTEHFSLKQNYAEQVKTIISAGRISPIKHIETLISAADILINQKGCQLKFEYYGSAPLSVQVPYFEKLKQEVKNKNLENQFIFAGSLPHFKMPERYQSADVFVNASNTQSLDKTVLEAMACGVAVINSNTAFKPILADWPQCLFEQGNAQQLAEKISQIVGLSQSERAQLGQSLRQIVVKGHNMNNLTTKIVEVFNL
ncbi:MAG: glycosyltransferase [Candidatus Komeilibacteria bacterium]|nr:glycosyltransferase [Candidatus Komeilibacteria bacterium]